MGRPNQYTKFGTHADVMLDRELDRIAEAIRDTARVFRPMLIGFGNSTAYGGDRWLNGPGTVDLLTAAAGMGTPIISPCWVTGIAFRAECTSFSSSGLLTAALRRRTPDGDATLLEASIGVDATGLYGGMNRVPVETIKLNSGDVIAVRMVLEGLTLTSFQDTIATVELQATGD